MKAKQGMAGYGRAALLLCLGWLCLQATMPAPAQAAESPPADKTLVVGTKIAPPFVMKAPDGDGYTGISIQLWETLAQQLGLHYRYEQRSLKQLFTGLEDGSLDIAVAALTATARREKRIDFAIRFYHGPGDCRAGRAQCGMGGAVGPVFLAVLRRRRDPGCLAAAGRRAGVAV